MSGPSLYRARRCNRILPRDMRPSCRMRLRRERLHMRAEWTARDAKMEERIRSRTIKFPATKDFVRLLLSFGERPPNSHSSAVSA